jgi:hypothetical protein
MICPQMLGQHKDTKNDPSFNHGCKTCDMMEECMEHKESLLKKAEGELKAKGNNKIKCSCTDAVSEERCKTCIAVNHPQYLKVQSELKAIKARIEAVKITDLYEIKERNKEYGCEDMQEIYHLIKQVGGEK